MRRVIMRVDAGLHIGIGHVMRCITLAHAIKEKDADVTFVCRSFEGHLGKRIISEGFQLHLLPPATKEVDQKRDTGEIPRHASWLGESWETDLEQTRSVLGKNYYDWLVVDHYSLDSRWEKAMRDFSHKVMVIDDLADRNHDCDLLMDQTLGRSQNEYKALVPEDCTLLMGSNYALLRPEFREKREYSLRRRAKGQIKHVLISMGGVDRPNVTFQVLKALQFSRLSTDCRITVVMGEGAPGLSEVISQSKNLVQPVEVKINVMNMADLMAESDIAIGTAGSTSWERCCLGLPTLMFVSEENQREIGIRLEQEQAVILLNNISEIDRSISLLSNSLERLTRMSQASQSITDGSGVGAVQICMEQFCAKN